MQSSITHLCTGSGRGRARSPAFSGQIPRELILLPHEDALQLHRAERLRPRQNAGGVNRLIRLGVAPASMGSKTQPGSSCCGSWRIRLFPGGFQLLAENQPLWNCHPRKAPASGGAAACAPGSAPSPTCRAAPGWCAGVGGGRQDGGHTQHAAAAGIGHLRAGACCSQCRRCRRGGPGTCSRTGSRIDELKQARSSRTSSVKYV